MKSYCICSSLSHLFHSRSIHVVKNSKILFFFCGWVIFHCVCVYTHTHIYTHTHTYIHTHTYTHIYIFFISYIFYTFIYPWMSRLGPYLATVNNTVMNVQDCLLSTGFSCPKKVLSWIKNFKNTLWPSVGLLAFIPNFSVYAHIPSSLSFSVESVIC